MEDESGVDSSSKTFSEWADEMCAYYMAIGVPCDEYWHGDPTQLQYYIKAHELRNEQRNQEMWLQGLYNCRAIASGMGSKDKRTKKEIEYFKEPIPIREKVKTESEKQVDAEKARQKIIADLTGWEKNWKKLKNKGR